MDLFRLSEYNPYLWLNFVLVKVLERLKWKTKKSLIQVKVENPNEAQHNLDFGQIWQHCKFSSVLFFHNFNYFFFQDVICQMLLVNWILKLRKSQNYDFFRKHLTLKFVFCHWFHLFTSCFFILFIDFLCHFRK